MVAGLRKNHLGLDILVFETKRSLQRSLTMQGYSAGCDLSFLLSHPSSTRHHTWSISLYFRLSIIKTSNITPTQHHIPITSIKIFRNIIKLTWIILTFVQNTSTVKVNVFKICRQQQTTC